MSKYKYNCHFIYFPYLTIYIKVNYHKSYCLSQTPQPPINHIHCLFYLPKTLTNYHKVDHYFHIVYLSSFYLSQFYSLSIHLLTIVYHSFLKHTTYLIKVTHYFIKPPYHNLIVYSH